MSANQTLITELPESDKQWVAPVSGFQRPPSPNTSTNQQEENSTSEIKMGDEDILTESPSIFDTWVDAAKKEEQEQQLLSTTNSNATSNGLSSTNGSSQQNVPRPPKKQRLGQCKGISKVRLVGDPNVEALEAKVAQRRAADKLRDEKIRKKIYSMEGERVRRETQLAELKKAQAEAEHRAKEEEFRRKHEEYLAMEAARKVRCSKLLKCDMDIIKGKKSIVQRFEDRKAELKKQDDEDLLIAKWSRHETCATGRKFYDKLREHDATVKARVDAEAMERQSRKLDMPPLPIEYMNKVRDQFLKQESERKAHLQTDMDMTVSHGFRSKLIHYANAVQREILPTLVTKPMVFEEEKKTIPREPQTAKDRMKEGNMAIHHHTSSPQETCWAHS